MHQQGYATPGSTVPCSTLLHHPCCTTMLRHQDLNMLCQTHGRERSVAEYRELLAAAGFEPYSVEGRVTGSYLDALLARKSRESVL